MFSGAPNRASRLDVISVSHLLPGLVNDESHRNVHQHQTNQTEHHACTPKASLDDAPSKHQQQRNVQQDKNDPSQEEQQLPDNDHGHELKHEGAKIQRLPGCCRQHDLVSGCRSA
jgi:hypothetical protein